jgi:hypothetical protein
MDLSQTDYKKIVHYYQIKKQKNKTYKESAEDILANKLCKCIKKVRPYDNNEDAAITICRDNIFKKRGIDFYNFKCKKGTKKNLRKFRKKIGFNKTKKAKKNK